MDGIIDGEVVKVDVKGRVQLRRERREALMAEFARSGMNGQQFAKWAGIKYSTFACWRRKQNQVKPPRTGESKAVKPITAVPWVEAVVREPDKNPTHLVIEMGAGVRLSIKDRGQAELAGVMLRELMAGGKSC